MKQNTRNSAQDTNVTNNQTGHIQNSVQGTNMTNSQQNIYKTVCETLM